MKLLHSMFFPGIFFILAIISAFPVQALTCKTTSSAISETVDIDKIIKVSSSELNRDQKIWVSHTITATFTCEDTDNHPQGENAYFWLDPENKVSSLPNFIKIGITYNGMDYILENNKKVLIGPATICEGSCDKQAKSVTFNLAYQVYIIATGSPVTDNGVISNNLKLSLFQVDGERGLRNGKAGDNYNLFINGLNSIKPMACVPTVSISPTSIDFGTISAGNARPGKYDRTRNFNVVYGLANKGNGTACSNEALLATFSSTNIVQDGSIILPKANGGFGIVISSNTTMTPRIEMNDPIKFKLDTGTKLTSTYTAGLLWLSNTPEVGEFSATATITVTFD